MSNRTYEQAIEFACKQLEGTAQDFQQMADQVRSLKPDRLSAAANLEKVRRYEANASLLNGQAHIIRRAL